MKAKTDQFQGDLFDGSRGPQKRPRRRFMRKMQPSKLIISYENMVLLLTGLFVMIIVSFSMGVERGKRLAAVKYEPEPKKVVAVVPVELAPLEQKQAPIPAPQKQAPAEQEPRLKPYTVQVATFQKNDLAEQEMEWLRGRGYYAFIIPRDQFLQVCVGEYDTKNEASESLSELKKRYKDCFLRKKSR